MVEPTDHETWIIEEGDRVIEKKVRLGVECLTNWERLVYSLWGADYGMRNAGDLEVAREVDADFQWMALAAAEQLSLSLTCEAFSMSSESLEREYFERFKALCDEIRECEPKGGV